MNTMETDVMTHLAKLPTMCASINATTGETILIKRGVAGFYPFPGKDAERFNARHGVTKAQRLAMEIGSMFGWEVPGADPDSHIDLVGVA